LLVAANITRLPSPTPFLLRAPSLHPKVNRFILLIHRTIHPWSYDIHFYLVLDGREQ
jgi:hypothetical protein